MTFAPHMKKKRRGRILVVDDETTVRRLIGQILTEEGFDVMGADTGEEAVRALTGGSNVRIDAILCDIRMFQIRGVEAITYFRTQYPGVPIVVLTSYPDIEQAVSLMRRGVLDYLVKPVAREELVSVVQHAVNQHTSCKDE